MKSPARIPTEEELPSEEPTTEEINENVEADSLSIEAIEEINEVETSDWCKQYPNIKSEYMMICASHR